MKESEAEALRKGDIILFESDESLFQNWDAESPYGKTGVVKTVGRNIYGEMVVVTENFGNGLRGFFLYQIAAKVSSAAQPEVDEKDILWLLS